MQSFGPPRAMQGADEAAPTRELGRIASSTETLELGLKTNLDYGMI